MSGAAANPDPKGPSTTIELKSSLPERDLGGDGPKPRAHVSAGPCSPETRSEHTLLAESWPPGEKRPLSSGHPRRNGNDLWRPRRISKWKSPLLLLIFFIIGLAMSIAHCVFYPKLSGIVVGNSSNQERNIRFGTAFSFLAQIALTATVWLSYTQLLWGFVGKEEVTVKGLNAAFGADTSVFSLLNFEMLRKFRTGSSMALFAWCLILPPFFTPATLFIYPSMETVEVEQLVRYPAISDSSFGDRFAYSPPYNNETKLVNDGSKIFSGPRTILTLISTATASFGQILPIKAPYNHSKYSTHFYGPIVHCDIANSSVTTSMYSLLQDETATPLGTAKETTNVYYAFVPASNASGGLVPLSSPRSQSPYNATNELWMTFLRYAIDSDGNHTREQHYQVCQLYNASYNIELEWDRGFQNVTGSYEILEKVYFPTDRPDAVSDMTQHSYSAFFWVLADQLVGTFSWFTGLNQSEFGVIDSQISRTSLLGTSDLDLFFDLNKNKGWSKDDNSTQISDQRLQDKALAKNRTLNILLEELSFNATVSLLHNELLTHNTTTKVLQWQSVNRYGYNPRGLFIPYALANLFTLITVLLGIFSYFRSGVHPDKKFQDIVSAAEDPRVIHVARNRRKSLTGELVAGKVILRPAAGS
ncbi:MAG: hypothetical protein M1839_004541 [Geoglossum umbratile]|nr:MAG: hypothetical protein M1839_004541 [Geoglossum umbratile]